MDSSTYRRRWRQGRNKGFSCGAGLWVRLTSRVDAEPMFSGGLCWVLWGSAVRVVLWGQPSLRGRRGVLGWVCLRHGVGWGGCILATL